MFKRFLIFTIAVLTATSAIASSKAQQYRHHATPHPSPQYHAPPPPPPQYHAPQPHRNYYVVDYKEEAIPLPPSPSMTGGYIGLSAGSKISYAAAPAVYSGVEGLLSIGYAGLLRCRIYLAAELFGGNSFQVVNYKPLNNSGSRTSWTMGASIIPGIIITDYVIGYLRLGAVLTHFRTNNNLSTCNCNDGVNRTAWQAGLGTEFNLCGNWDLRTEYTYSQYPRVNSIGHPRINQFNLGILYRMI